MTATAQASRVIPANEAEVWETLTSQEGMKAYMMGAEVQADWRVGGPIVMRGEYNGKPFEDRGEVRSFEPWRRLSYTHTSSAAPDQTHVVTIELEPQDDGTEVKVTQENADGSVTEADKWRQADYEKTWSKILERLADAVVD
ncbi:SRPBCC domain-containing protein [Phenylobacterium sp.]|uniref:SRPBCC family protein n=1 Tax=Phenylobacterium sp. TaxID=1871053 RepID=UPI0011F4B71A|nr:SRPBCC domain-containing protein [Phenylobacterium sp.]THD61996.1 MAG: SRPBCC domain-containing protein [Phenylobacterium sp.]